MDAPLQPPPASPEPPDRPLFDSLLQRLSRLPTMLGLATGLVMLAVPLGFGVWAFRSLMVAPEFAGCEDAAEASGSVRLHCAGLLAGKQTVESLSQAIALAESIPAEDPLVSEADRLMEQWSQQLLQKGEDAFQDGDLERAIAATRSIPMATSSYPAARDRADQWRTTWSNAEAIAQEVEAGIEREDWTGSFSIARKLRTIGNRYWETTKYQELMQTLAEAKGDGRSQKASARATKPGDDLLSRWKQQQQLEDAAHLAKARDLSQSGNLAGLNAAVNEAEQVLYGTARYNEAQQLVATWKSQIETLEDRPYLSRATKLAAKGDAESLQQAIDEAGQILYGRALYNEARNQIDRWNEQVRQLRAQSQMNELRTLSPSDRSLPPITPEPMRSPSL